MVVVNSTIEYAPYSFQTSGSFRTFCEHSNSSWSMFEPAEQASLRKELSDRRRSKMCESDESENYGTVFCRASSKKNDDSPRFSLYNGFRYKKNC